MKRDQFTGIVEVASAAGLAVIGHGVRQPGMEGILQGGQVMIAHGEEYGDSGRAPEACATIHHWQGPVGLSGLEGYYVWASS